MSNLSKLNKDLLIKLIEEINDSEKLSIEELDDRIKIYGEIQKRKIHERDVKMFKDLILKLEIIPCLTDHIRTYREKILQMNFPSDRFSHTEEDRKILSKIRIYIPNGIGEELSYINFNSRYYKNYKDYTFERIHCPTNKHDFHIKLKMNNLDNKEFILLENITFTNILFHECF